MKHTRRIFAAKAAALALNPNLTCRAVWLDRDWSTTPVRYFQIFDGAYPVGRASGNSTGAWADAYRVTSLQIGN